MNLGKRVEELEKRMDDCGDFRVCFIVFMSADPDSTGDDRPIHRPVSGYRSAGGNMEWTRLEGESVADLRARVERDVRAARDANSRSVLGVVCECYSDEATAQA